MSHIVLAPARTGASAGLAQRVASLLRTGWRSYRRGRKFRATIRAIDHLDDHTLRDIGLHRGDFGAAVRRVCRDA